MNKHLLRNFTLATLVWLSSQCAHGAPRLQWSDRLGTSLTEQIRNGEYGTVSSVLLVSDGEIVFEYNADGFDATSLHNTRSVTKTLTGMAFGAAVADGLITVESTLAGYFADIAPFENPDQRKLELTAEDLITMSGPMECDDWNSFSRGNEERMYLIEDWSRFFWNLPIRGFPAWAPKTRSAPFDRAFSYCSAGVQVLGEVVERVTELPFTRFFQERFFEPMGIENFRWGFNGQGRPHLMGGLELTSRGLAAFAELQRNEGRYEGRQLLPRDWVKASATAHTRVPDDVWEYGYLWWLRDYEVSDQSYSSSSMTGNGGNRVLVIPGLGVSLVITKTDFNQRDMHLKTDALVGAILGALEGNAKNP
jgi:CubicO group peptidase (beta-lactamase class C family)